jgi:hypothetical protein
MSESPSSGPLTPTPTPTPFRQFIALVTTHDFTTAEFLFGGMTVLCGSWMLLSREAAWVHPAWWGWLLVIIGFSRMTAVVLSIDRHNVERWLLVRVFAASVTCGLWTYLSAWFQRDRPWSLAVPLTGALAVGSLSIVVRLILVDLLAAKRRRFIPWWMTRRL